MTLFEDLREEVDIENGRSPFFYRRAFRRLTKRYMAQPNLFIRDERKDNNEAEMEGTGSKSTMTPAHAWYETIMVLTGGTFKDIEYVVNRPFREAFNFLAWKKTKMLEEQMELNKMKQKMNK